MTPEAVNDFANILVFTSLVPSLGYTLTYGLGSPWYKSLLGVVMFMLGVSLSGVLIVNIARRLYDEYPGYEWVAVTNYSLITLVMWGLWAIVIIERRRGGRALGFTLAAVNQEKGNTMTVTTGYDADGKPVTTDAATGQPTAMPTPKVVAGAVSAGALVVVVAVLTAITPDLLAFAGPWAPVLMAGVVALAGFLGGYVKRP